MDISSLLKVILLDVKGKDHEAVLREMSSRLFPTAPEAEKALCDLKDHESTEGVLAGTGTAVFHCLSDGVEEPLMAMAISKRPVMRARKKLPVQIFFLLISPIKESGTHLQLLSRIEALLFDRGFRRAMLSAKGEEAVRREIRRIEGTSRSLFIPLSREEIFSELKTGPAGLTVAEAASRLRLIGPNSIRRIERSPLLKDFLHNMFLNLFAVLLWAGGAMAFVAGMPELGWAIFLVIIINALFSFWQEYKAEKAVEALGRLLPKKVRVIRGGEERTVDATAIVPGDLLKLSEGEGVPADGRLVEAQEMRVDNSALTGESKPVYKVSEPLADGAVFIWTEIPNLVFAGTSVVSGSGTMVATATGMDTEIGRVAYLTQAIKAEMSPLQKEITRITKTVTLIALSLGALFFLLGYSFGGLTFAESFIFAIGIIVANVPEGLLPTVSLSLAMGVERMAGKKAIVKKLSAVETLGSATVICTDKTGTLTTNQMCVQKVFVNWKLLDVTGTGYAPEGSFVYHGRVLSREDLDRDGVIKLLEAAALCNNAALHSPARPGAPWTVSGDPTEAALLTAAGKAGVDTERLKEEYSRTAHLPFERIRKRMSTVHNLPEGASGKGGAIAFVKGAPKETLDLCTRILVDGIVKDLTPEERERAVMENDLLASRGLRVLAVASREIEGKESYTASGVEQDLTFIGLVAMLDPPRPEVRRAIEECHGAGIRVMVITGDYGLTARAIAEEIGFPKGTRVVSGEDLGRMGRRELQEMLRKEEVIFARATPADKLRVVEALQGIGEVVAVTGDGVNDAPALKKADIGIAMGLRGSDVAKESAEIILADDNFSTIVEAVREGRAVYANIKKFVTYIFASNIPEIVPFIAFVLFKIPLPLTVIQILAVDLGTDVLPALALGVEPPEKGVMEEPPRPKGKKLLDMKTLFRAYLFLGPIEAVLAMGAFFFAYAARGWTPGAPLSGEGAVYAVATTMTFAGIVASQVGNVFACRTDRGSVFTAGFFRNPFVIYSVIAEVAIMLAIIYTPFLNSVFGFHPPATGDWAIIIVFPAVILLAEEARKWVLRRLRRR